MGATQGRSARKRTWKLGLRDCKAAKHSGDFYVSSNGREVPAREMLWDSEIKGLGLCVCPSGRKCWVLQFRFRGRTRVVDLGDFPGLPPEGAKGRPGARQSARIAVGRLTAGQDPFLPKSKGRTFAEIQEQVPEALRKGR